MKGVELNDDLEERLRRSEALLSGQNEVFALLASGAPRRIILEKLIFTIESLVSGMRGSILLLDDDGKHLKHGAAPSLPEEYNKAIDGAPIGPTAGSCGTAAYRKQTVIVTDIFKDALWEEYRELAMLAKVHACWSTPIVSKNGEILGAFAMYYNEVRRPTEYELQMIQDSSHIAAVVIEQIRTQNALQKSISLLQATLDSTADGILVVDRHGSIVEYNQRFLQMWGISGSFHSPRNDTQSIQLVLEQVRNPEHFLNKIKELYKQPESESYDTIEFKDGRVFERYSKPQKLDGKIVGRVWSFRDVTLRKRLEQKLREDEGRFHFLADAGTLLAEALDIHVCADRLAKLLLKEFADWAYVVLTDHFQVAVLAHPDPEKQLRWQELEKNQKKVRVPKTLWKVMRTGKAVICNEISDAMLEECVDESTHLFPSNYLQLIRDMGVQSYMAVPLIARGKVQGVVVCVSATDRKRYTLRELAIVQDLGYRAALVLDDAYLYVESQKAVKLREDFLSIASHELKTPITALKLQVQLLRRLLLDKTVLQHPMAKTLAKVVEGSEKQLDSFSKLVTDLLDVTKIGAGKLTLRYEDVCLSDLVSEVLDRYHDELIEAGCQVYFQSDHEVFGCWDLIRMEQVVVNLLTNAMKYGAGKPIEISLHEVGGNVKLSVRDHGIGIAKEDQERIFKRFERAVTSKAFSGFGLGLFIANQIVTAHGGAIRVESEPTHGATFTVEIPARLSSVCSSKDA